MDELKSGSSVTAHAIILGVFPYRDSDLIVHLLCAEFGKISAIARSAKNSRKRFGPALQPSFHVKIEVKIPKQNQESGLWSLQRAELQNEFAGFRKSFDGIETALFATRLVQDLIPEGAKDASLFRNLGRFLKAGQGIDWPRYKAWGRMLFWSYFSFTQGYGSLLSSLGPDFLLPELHEFLIEKTETDDVDFEEVFRGLNQAKASPLGKEKEQIIYRKWLELSGVEWKNFERWVQSAF